MTLQEATTFLNMNARRSHLVVFGTSGGGHGEPGGVPFIKTKCSCIVDDGFGNFHHDHSIECDCGAKKHNEKVSEAINLITKELFT